MKTRRRVGMFLSITGLAILATSGYLWRGNAASRAELGAKIVVLEDSVARVHDEVVKTNLKYRAFQNSLPNMPDTLQRYGGRKWMAIGTGYSKSIRKLEMRERDIQLEIKALERRLARERERARSAAIPAAAAGALAAIAGVILFAVPGRRVGA